jgi:hypothetical protein
MSQGLKPRFGNRRKGAQAKAWAYLKSKGRAEQGQGQGEAGAKGQGEAEARTERSGGKDRWGSGVAGTP